MALVKYFGVIAEKTNCNQEIIDTHQITITDIMSVIVKKYDLKNTKISIAINKDLIDIKSKKIVTNSDEIALLPPFAGG